jgi:copper transport protein
MADQGVASNGECAGESVHLAVPATRRIAPALRRLLFGFGLVVLLIIGGTPGVASAHAQLESTSPSQGAVLLVPPKQVVLHFGEPVEIDFGSLRVIGPSGARVDRGGTHHPNNDTHAVATSLPSLPDGTYVVAWRVISADSHPVHGAFVFSVGTARGAAKANALAVSIANQSGSSAVGVVYWLIRTGAFVGLLFLVGPAVLVTLAWREGARSRRVGNLLWFSWWLLLAATLLGIAIQGIYASALPLTDVYQLSLIGDVLHTRFGEVQLLRLVLLAAMVPTLLGLQGRIGPESRRWAWVTPAVCALGLVLLATPGLAGHAATGSSPALGLGLDVAHLAAAAAWLGGLGLLATFLVPRTGADALPSDPMLLTRRVSFVAFCAVVLIVGTGVFQSIRQVGSFYALFHTVYGRTLLVKIALVVLLIGLGAISRRIVYTGARGSVWTARRSAASDPAVAAAPLVRHPGVAVASNVAVEDRIIPSSDEPAFPRRRLRRSVAAELAVAVAVLAVSALLVNAVPAKQAAALPYSYSFSTLGVQVNSIIDPARAGPGNEVHVYVLSSLGTPKAIPELDLSIALPAQSIGPLSVPLVIAGPGHYYAGNFDIPSAGTWVLKYTVRVDAIDEQVVTTDLPVH